MYQIKNRIYLSFDKTQKSGICNSLRVLVKQNAEKTCEEILDKFIYDEKYYLSQSSSRFPFLENYIDDADFVADTKLYIKECLKYYQYKEKQKPIIMAQKQYEKQKKQYLQELKMSKQEPTQKQLYMRLGED